jgi:hypothetical protein
LSRYPEISRLPLRTAFHQPDLTVLHVDKDFDLIAGVTGQPVERLALA